MPTLGSLTFFCGKMGAGKSTKAMELAQSLNTVLLSEDIWLESLYPKKITTLSDYRQYSALLKPLLQEHVADILRSGSNVVMDFPANTQKQRAWLREIAHSAGAAHQMVYLQLSDERCLVQIAQRRLEQPDRAIFDTEEVFRQVTHYFEEPQGAEGINTVVVSR